MQEYLLKTIYSYTDEESEQEIMAITVKLNSWEQEALRERFNLVNRKLVMKGMKPLTAESQVVHKILEISLNKLNVDEEGNLKIEL